MALCAERNTPVRLAIDGSTMTLESGTGDEAQASEVLDGIAADGTISAAFNPAFLEAAIVAVSAGTVRMSFTSATKPAVITAAAGKVPDYRHVLMPIRNAG